MVSLPQHKSSEKGEKKSGCGSCGTDNGGHCGAGLEKVYPTTAVRYGAMNFIGEFTYKPGSSFQCGGKVVIQSDRGIELGEQVSLFCNGCSNQVTRAQIKEYINNSGPEFFRLNAGRIMREASPDDVNDHTHLNAHVRDDLERCAMLAMQLDLPMKIVTSEHLLGGERIVFYFRSDERIDFRDLVRELAAHYRTRIEMRQVGARDEARLVADYEICGRECCCKNFLKKLRPVSMKMAKVQKATLDPSKVSGRCGRLRCCLRYEHEGYEALMKKLPRINARVRTEFGDGLVIDRQILTQLLMVELDDQRRIAVPVEEILESDLPPRATAVGALSPLEMPLPRPPRSQAGPARAPSAPPVAADRPIGPGRPELLPESTAIAASAPRPDDGSDASRKPRDPSESADAKGAAGGPDDADRARRQQRRDGSTDEKNRAKDRGPRAGAPVAATPAVPGRPDASAAPADGAGGAGQSLSSSQRRRRRRKRLDASGQSGGAGAPGQPRGPSAPPPSGAPHPRAEGDDLPRAPERSPGEPIP